MTCMLYSVILRKINKSKDGKIWGFGLFDIPKESKIRNCLNEEALNSISKNCDEMSILD